MDRYFHLRVPHVSKGGATVFVSGQIGAALVFVGVAECSPKDNFARKEGRDVAFRRYTRHVRRVPLAALPALLRQAQRRALKRAYGIDDPKLMPKKAQELWDYDFSFAMKYWTPKVEKPEEGGGGAPVVDADLMTNNPDPDHRLYIVH